MFARTQDEAVASVLNVPLRRKARRIVQTYLEQ